jgi:hypothetical protein
VCVCVCAFGKLCTVGVNCVDIILVYDRKYSRIDCTDVCIDMCIDVLIVQIVKMYRLYTHIHYVRTHIISLPTHSALMANIYTKKRRGREGRLVGSSCVMREREGRRAGSRQKNITHAHTHTHIYTQRHYIHYIV